MTDYAVTATGLIKNFGDTRAVDGVDLAVPRGAIYGVLGPNGAGKTTTLRMLLGIIDPDAGTRSVLEHSQPLEAASEIGYLPEERGLYPGMMVRDAIAFLGNLRGLPLAEGRRRADRLLAEHGLPHVARRQVRTLSKGMAQTAQLLGTLIHNPKLLVLDEPFSGLDALNQEKLEATIRAQAAKGTTVLFSTHVIAHAERLCERIAIIAGGKVRFEGAVDDARAKLRPIVRLRTREVDGPWRAAIPADVLPQGRDWRFELPVSGVEALLKGLVEGGAGIDSLSIERPGLHDAFIAIAGAAAADAMGKPVAEEAQ